MSQVLHLIRDIIQPYQKIWRFNVVTLDPVTQTAAGTLPASAIFTAIQCTLHWTRSLDRSSHADCQSRGAATLAAQVTVHVRYGPGHADRNSLADCQCYLSSMTAMHATRLGHTDRSSHADCQCHGNIHAVCTEGNPTHATSDPVT